MTRPTRDENRFCITVIPPFRWYESAIAAGLVAVSIWLVLWWIIA